MNLKYMKVVVLENIGSKAKYLATLIFFIWFDDILCYINIMMMVSSQLKLIGGNGELIRGNSKSLMWMAKIHVNGKDPTWRNFLVRKSMFQRYACAIWNYIFLQMRALECLLIFIHFDDRLIHFTTVFVALFNLLIY